MTNAKPKFNAAKLARLKIEVDAGFRRLRDLGSSADFFRQRAGTVEAEMHRHPLGRLRVDQRDRARDDLRASFAALERRLAADRAELRKLDKERDRIAADQEARAALLARCIDVLKARGLDPNFLDDRPSDVTRRPADISITGRP